MVVVAAERWSAAEPSLLPDRLPWWRSGLEDLLTNHCDDVIHQIEEHARACGPIRRALIAVLDRRPRGPLATADG